MFGVQVPLGAAVQPRVMVVPKAVKWQHMLPDAKNQSKLKEGWDVAYCDGSSNKLRICHMQGLLCGLVTVTHATTSNQRRWRSGNL